MACPDPNTSNLLSLQADSQQRKGARVMHFGAYRTDLERRRDCSHKNSVIDSVPAEKPEHRNWVMRPRARREEIGPQFRFNSNLQIERVMDRICHDTGRYF